MKNIRLIGRLDIKGENLIKGIQLEGLRVIGNPNEYAKLYYQQGIDELIYIDSVASLYGRNNLAEIVSKTTSEVFVPVTVGGGIRTLKDIDTLLKSGADKVAINTEGVKNPNFFKEAVETFGSQSIVGSIVAKKISSNNWEVYTDGGREKTGLNVENWLKVLEDKGIGELLITSVDRDGTKSGFDYELVSKVSKICNVPLIISGGAGEKNHLLKILKNNNLDAIAVGSILHFKNQTVKSLKSFLINNNIKLRLVE